RLVAAAEKLRVGPGWEEGVDVGPVINQSALEKIDSYTQSGKDEGAKLLTGGEVAGGNGLGDGFFYRPTIFGDVQPDMRVAQEEIFGPTTALIPVRDVDEAIRVSNGIEYGLSSSIFTRDVNTAFRAMRDLEAGITYINAGTIWAEVRLPFRGVKGTGNHLRGLASDQERDVRLDGLAQGAIDAERTLKRSSPDVDTAELPIHDELHLELPLA